MRQNDTQRTPNKALQSKSVLNQEKNLTFLKHIQQPHKKSDSVVFCLSPKADDVGDHV
jgi:hypothetical protein